MSKLQVFFYVVITVCLLKILLIQMVKYFGDK